LNATDDDTYWAAKIVMSFSVDEIRAIVRTGGLTDPAAEEYLVNTLIERRDKIGRYWLTRKSSFDHFTFEDGELHFRHLASEFDLAPRPASSGEWFVFDPNSEKRWPIEGEDAPGPGQYFLVEITSTEGKVKVYIGNRNGRLQVVGVER
jgi:hypothetical protein